MTKRVRIENADTSDHKLMVEVWDKGMALESGGVEPDTMVEKIPLMYPTEILEKYVHCSRYIVIKEI
jgi:hypothetical protein